MQLLIARLERFHTLWIITLSLTISFLWWGVILFIAPLYEQFFGEIKGPEVSEYSFIGKFFLVTFFVPLLETAIFQLLIIYILNQFTKLSLTTIIIISAAYFSLSHLYGALYIMYAFAIGIVSAITFIVCYKKQMNYFFAFVIVSLIHSLFYTFMWGIHKLYKLPFLLY